MSVSDPAVGLSPSIHSIDQIKVLDRFREIPPDGPIADLVWSDPDPEKEDFAISPRFVHAGRLRMFPLLTEDAGELDTPLVPGSSTSFSRSTRCPISCELINYAWKVIHPCSIGISQQCGPLQTTVIYSALSLCSIDVHSAGYRCGNSASILEVGPGGSMYFNVFEAAPENDRDGPSQQAAQNANGKVLL